MPATCRERRSSPSRGRGEGRGQSVLELALLLPVVLLILVGLLELGQVFYAYISVQDAARAGARYASLNPGDPTGARQRVLGESAATLDLGPSNNRISIGVDYLVVSGLTETITVTVRYSATTTFLGPITQLVASLGGGSGMSGGAIPMTAASSMPVMTELVPAPTPTPSPTPTGGGTPYDIPGPTTVIKNQVGTYDLPVMVCGAGSATSNTVDWTATSQITLRFKLSVGLPTDWTGATVSTNPAGGGATTTTLSQVIAAGSYRLYVKNEGSMDATVQAFRITCP